MSKETNRRDFYWLLICCCCCSWGCHVACWYEASMDPLPSVLAGGFTEIDLSAVKAGEPETLRGEVNLFSF